MIPFCVHLSQHPFCYQVSHVLTDLPIRKFDLVDDGVAIRVVVILSHRTAIRSEHASFDHSFHHLFVKLHLYFCINDAVVHRTLVDELSSAIHRVLDVGSRKLLLVVILIRLSSFAPFGWRCWRHNGVAIPPLNQSVKCLTLGLFAGAVDLGLVERTDRTPRDYQTICLQHPLCHFVPFTTGWSQHTSQNFLVVGKLGSVLPEIAPLIPGELPKTRYVTLLSKGDSVGIRTPDGDVILYGEVVDTYPPLKTVVPEREGRVGLMHIFLYGFLHQLNVELCLVCPWCTFLQCMESGSRSGNILSIPNWNFALDC